MTKWHRKMRRIMRQYMACCIVVVLLLVLTFIFRSLPLGLFTLAFTVVVTAIYSWRVSKM
ncbi:hypothetical protein MPK70_gp264 [Erwinia phage pEa_SNUABM_33]|uniref:Uncharacterized protein n=1 Tax=Erwinia phage pEa_SNUABM_33 TaxID=2869556 RepID=A0AAE7XMC4_9CAUD|nr:hypothetical protein MPK70_gp264 [Erwinia phage pEa_SNUABM_33]QZE58140.1 hypothetical protein pEaSNUABM33_00264 [Erwinia phage pEa_SNUABM_33]